MNQFCPNRVGPLPIHENQSVCLDAKPPGKRDCLLVTAHSMNRRFERPFIIGPRRTMVRATRIDTFGNRTSILGHGRPTRTSRSLKVAVRITPGVSSNRSRSTRYAGSSGVTMIEVTAQHAGPVLRQRVHQLLRLASPRTVTKEGAPEAHAIFQVRGYQEPSPPRPRSPRSQPRAAVVHGEEWWPSGSPTGGSR